jgi:hypothetical protein
MRLYSLAASDAIWVEKSGNEVLGTTRAVLPYIMTPDP